jgi:23S rRNA-/tRNA-specific pseudouridylate synthase
MTITKRSRSTSGKQKKGASAEVRGVEGVLTEIEMPHIIKEESDYYIIYNPPFWKVDTDTDYDKFPIEQQKEIYLKEKVFQLYCKFELGIEGIPQQGACHRYDKETSGNLLVVKRLEDYQLCRGIISDKKNTIKLYVALVNGIISEKKGFVYSNIDCNKAQSQRGNTYMLCQSTVVPEAEANSASYYEVVEEYNFLNPEDNNTYQFSLVQVRIFTGRTHQIRLHMSNLGCCIVSDRNYCSGKRMNSLISNRLFLHNFYLQFIWKGTQKHYSNGLPADLAESLAKLKSIKKYKKIQDIDELLKTTSNLA